MKTGIKDVDKLILEQLDVRSMLNYCNTNQYTRSLCDDEFFKRKSIETFSQNFIRNNKENLESWKEFYLKTIKIPWNKLYKSSRQELESPGYPVNLSKNGLTKMIQKLEVFYEFLLNIDPKLFEAELIKWDNYYGVILYKEYLKYGYFNAYDKRRIIEYMFDELLELSYIRSQNKEHTTISQADVDQVLNSYDLFRLF